MSEKHTETIRVITDVVIEYETSEGRAECVSMALRDLRCRSFGFGVKGCYEVKSTANRLDDGGVEAQLLAALEAREEADLRLCARAFR